jgi:predicted patatin/cPLA2 family phospholipase
MNKTGLVLEGGGMRGIYTAGVLDAFIEHDIQFDYIIGVSSGANNGSNYLTKQQGRSKRILLAWSQDERFIGFNNLFKHKTFFGMEFLFNHLPNHLEPFDYTSFYSSDTEFCTCATNCDTGEPEYFYKRQVCPLKYMNKILRASSSLPVISPMVSIDNQHYIDGFVTDPVPIDKSISDGNTKNVVILTKSQSRLTKLTLMDWIMKNLAIITYPKLRNSINESRERYNKSLDKVFELSEAGHVFVYKPKKDFLNSRYKINYIDLRNAYKQGYTDAIDKMPQLKKWLSTDE